jgi:hypothetical protein
MSFASIRLICLVSIMSWTILPSLARADVVRLKNGSRIEGKVTDLREKGGGVVVAIGDVGHTTLSAREVESVSMDPQAAPAKTDALPIGDFVAVKLPAAAEYYGKAVYHGTVSALSTDQTLALELPGGGIVRIARVPGMSIEKSELAAAGWAPATPPPAEKSIKTTHVVKLKNGRAIAGTVVPTPESEPVKIQFGSMGSMSIPRDQIVPDGIQAAEGLIKLPEAPQEVAPPAQKTEIPADLKEQLKRELREEILRELLDRIIDEKVGAAMEAVGATSMLPREDAGLSNEDILAIQDEVRELSRERTRNRVRAERHLISMGSAVLPYLAAVAGHPFELTRRSVQRIVRDIDDVRGAPLAVAALNDSDEWVRVLAHEALAALLPSDISYDPKGSEKERLEAQASYRALWQEIVRNEVRQAALASRN